MSQNVIDEAVAQRKKQLRVAWSWMEITLNIC